METRMKASETNGFCDGEKRSSVLYPILMVTIVAIVLFSALKSCGQNKVNMCLVPLVVLEVDSCSNDFLLYNSFSGENELNKNYYIERKTTNKANGKVEEVIVVPVL